MPVNRAVTDRHAKKDDSFTQALHLCNCGKLGQPTGSLQGVRGVCRKLFFHKA